MTLERWTVHRYRAPRLDVQAIRRADDSVEIDAPRGVVTLTCNDASLIDGKLLPVLEGLRDADSDVWKGVRSGTHGDLLPLLRDLDVLGLIRDANPSGAIGANVLIETIVREWSTSLGRELASRGDAAVAGATELVERVAHLEPRAATLADARFPVVTLLLQARYLRRDAPALFAVLLEGLRAAVRDPETHSFRLDIDDWSLGIIDVHTVKQYLAATRALVLDIFEPDAIRRAWSQRTVTKSVAGINFLLDLEHEVTRLLLDLGESPAVAAVQDPSLAPRVVRAAFLQEYFVTCRYVEIVAPLLSKRFPEALRDSVHRYFGEEMGHERFERENCLRLGMTQREIDASGPLPLHLAYVDILTALAAESPVSFFCASMFTEGMISTSDSLVSLAAEAIPDDPIVIAAISEHVAVNEESDHRGVGRDWMSHVPVVDERLQTEIGNLIAYLAELNWRMWQQLVRDCG